MDLKAVRGMHDLHGEEIARWHWVESKVRDVFRAFGYQEIRTPVLEKLEVFKQTVGDDTDIVEKQMYTVASDGEDKMVLRPEGTAAFIRAVVEHGLQQTGHPQRYFYYLPMFRHERPQKGRLRQFHQFGGEIINDPSPEADVEIIALLDQTYRVFNVTEYEVRINSVGCIECRPVYKEALKLYFAPHLKSLCELCQKRFERSPLRILDCKKPECQKLALAAPKITAHLCQSCQAHQHGVKQGLQAAKIKFIEDPNIVRGLDYYCRTAFEFTSDLLGAQSALGAGGRYDGVSTRFGDKGFPAVGYALGMERLVLVLEQKQAFPTMFPKPDLFLAPLGEKAFKKLFPISFTLRRKGVATLMPYERDKALKWIVKQSDRVGARYTLILGEDEFKTGKALLKDMQARTQDSLPLEGLEDELLRRLKS